MNRYLLWGSRLLVLSQFVLVSVSWSSLPEEIPIHFDLEGQADRIGSKQTIWLLPVISLLLVLMFEWIDRSVLNRLPMNESPTFKQELRLSKRMMYWLSLFFSAIFLYLSWLVIEVSLEQRVSLGSSFIWITGIGTGVILLVYVIAIGALKFGHQKEV